MDPSINLQNARNIRVTCNHAVIEGLTLDLNMMNVAPEDKVGPQATPVKAATGSVPVSSATASIPGSTFSATIATAPTTSTTTVPNPPLLASDHAGDGKFHLLLAASGSVATIKIPNIIRGLSGEKNVSIRVILTESAAKFLRGQSEEQPTLATIARYPNVEAIYRDEDEWRIPWTRGAPILHIELRRWADLLVIAPLSANTLAKISNGFSDNLLTSVVRAWQVEPVQSSNNLETATTAAEVTGSPGAAVQKRILVAPAMNTAMWRHPLTARHLRAPGEDQYYHWFDILRPVEKTLACGDSGTGAMCEWTTIVSTIQERIAGCDKFPGRIVIREAVS